MICVSDAWRSLSLNQGLFTGPAMTGMRLRQRLALDWPPPFPAVRGRSAAQLSDPGLGAYYGVPVNPLESQVVVTASVDVVYADRGA